MKKIAAITALLVFAGSSCFAAALATGAVTTTDGMVIRGGTSTAIAEGNTGVTIGKCSNGVRLSSAYNTGGYAFMSKHDQGSKAFGTAHDATAIYTTEIGTGALTAVPSTVGYASFSTWTAM